MHVPVMCTRSFMRLELTHSHITSYIVISYVGETDRDLAREVIEVTEDKSKSFNSIFSRNKMLRRRINRKKAANSQ